MLRNTTLATLALLVAAVSANAAPIVTMTRTANIGGGAFDSLDFFFTSTPGAEFLNYRLDVQSTNGNNLQDPSKTGTSDEGGDAVDTWMNTVYSLNGFGNASYNFNQYKPVGLGSGTPPVARIDWSVFDSGSGDGNTIDAGGGDIRNAPWHLARVLISPNTVGTATFTGFDSLTLDQAGGAIGTAFAFPIGIPEPTTFTLVGLALAGGLGFLRRRS